MDFPNPCFCNFELGEVYLNLLRIKFKHCISAKVYLNPPKKYPVFFQNTHRYNIYHCSLHRSVIIKHMKTLESEIMEWSVGNNKLLTHYQHYQSLVTQFLSDRHGPEASDGRPQPPRPLRVRGGDGVPQTIQSQSETRREKHWPIRREEGRCAS